MTKVFISYSRKDLKFVEQLAVDLTDAGLDVWYDLSGLEGGSQWSQEISKAIHNCDHVIMVVSPDSIKSKWVEEEFLLAGELKKNIIPLHYRKSDIPFGYRTLHFINIQGSSYQKNFNEILRALGIKKPPTQKPSESFGKQKTIMPKTVMAIVILLAAILGINNNFTLFNTSKKPTPTSLFTIISSNEPTSTYLSETLPSTSTPTQENTPDNILTSTASKSPIPTFTYEPATVGTPDFFYVSLSRNTNCRTGTDEQYELLFSLQKNTKAAVLAIDPTGDYFYIRNPGNPSEYCWILNRYDVSSGNRDILPLFTPPALPSSTPTPFGKFDEFGTEMVFIANGNFLMGTDNVSTYVASFFIDKYEVTNASYQNCVVAGVCSPPKDDSSSTRKVYYGATQFNNFPVVHVDWGMARTYCEWRGARLPTEAEWEKAIRGTDQSSYVWALNLSCESANYSDCTGDTVPVDSYSRGASIYGVYGMVGNVSEWVNSLSFSLPYDSKDGRESLQSPDNRVVRGSSWVGKYYANELLTLRYSAAPNISSERLGFRCAKDAP